MLGLVEEHKRRIPASFDDPGILRIQGKAKDDSNVTDLVTALKKTQKFGSLTIDRIDSKPGGTSVYRKDFTINAVLAGVDPKKKT